MSKTTLHTTEEELAMLEKTFVNPDKIDERVETMVSLLKKEKPEMTKDDMAFVQRAAIKYAKEVLKGKAAVLYGMSLDWAIKALMDEDTTPKIKADLVNKVLGHCLPTEVHLTGGDDEGTKPILFQMARPINVIESDKVEEDGPRPKDPIYSPDGTKQVP